MHIITRWPARQRCVPGMSGLAVLHKIREEQPALVAIQAGAQAYLLKPFEAAQLKEIVERWVGPGR